jgi:hypothetical protein
LEGLDSWRDLTPGVTRILERLESLRDRTHEERQDKWRDFMDFWRYRIPGQTGHWRDRSPGETELLKRLDSQKDQTPGEFGLQKIQASWSDWTPGLHGDLGTLKRLDSRCDWTPEEPGPQRHCTRDCGS